MKLSLLLLIILMLVLAGWFLIQKNPASNIIKSETVKTAIVASPSPSPFLFEELTIPYLRNRQYQSMLGDMQKYQDNGSFTSYLTSYSSDELKINGLLTQPNSEKPPGGFPAIVFIHGYIAPTIYKTT